ncbi:MAG: hypothetical protein IPJ08_19805 [Burkholderiales bacterium]|nr:hypothetical protein [Burkholderiales bacterium]
MSTAKLLITLRDQARQLKQHVGIQVWLIQHGLAESRDAHIAFNRHLRAAACSLGLAMTKLNKIGRAEK